MLRLTLLLMIALPSIGMAEELRIPGATAYLEPDTDGARVAEEQGITRWNDPQTAMDALLLPLQNSGDEALDQNEMSLQEELLEQGIVVGIMDATTNEKTMARLGLDINIPT